MTGALPRARHLCALIAVLLLAAGCSDEHGEASPDPDAFSASELPVGKSDLDLDAGTYTSPGGFQPVLVVEVPEGWQSVHRDVDAFDFGKPDPDKDAPLVAVVVMRPPEATAAEALAAVHDRAGAHATPVDGDIGAIPAGGLDIDGGTGQVVASASGGVALDAAPGQRMRILGADVGGVPLLVVVLVPDGDRWDDALPEAQALLDGFGPAPALQ
jgi:hypothetical protein